jgi:hypothetical protein
MIRLAAPLGESGVGADGPEARAAKKATGMIDGSGSGRDAFALHDRVAAGALRLAGVATGEELVALRGGQIAAARSSASSGLCA